MSSLNPKLLNLIILPTEQCNFRCTYCYEDFSKGQMQPEVEAGISNLIRNRASTLDGLSLSWFGGEPLMALSVIDRISACAALEASKHGFAFDANITTNAALLKRPVIDRLTDWHVRTLQVSLDGMGVVHDRTRRHANGSGTFDSIAKNLFQLRDSVVDTGVLIRVHLQRETAKELEELVSWLGNEFAGDARFQVYLKPIENLGGSCSAADVLGEKEKTRLWKTLNEMLPEDLRMEDPFNNSGDYVCYASKPNSLMIRANGQLGKCTVALQDEVNNLGFLSPDGTVHIDQTRLRHWIRGIESMDPGVLACPSHEQ